MDQTSTAKSRAQRTRQAPDEPRTIRYWPISMLAELDEPIGFAPTCPTSAAYRSAGKKVSA